MNRIQLSFYNKKGKLQEQHTSKSKFKNLNDDNIIKAMIEMKVIHETTAMVLSINNILGQQQTSTDKHTTYHGTTLNSVVSLLT